MELDKRIIKGKRPLTCLDVEQAREFVGKECIFSDKYEKFKDINKYLFPGSDHTGILSIDERASCGDYVFRNGTNDVRYDLVLPWEWVEEEKKEPKYRPYTIDTFLKKFKLGDSIILRRKGSDTYEELLFTGYSGENVHLGACVFGFNSLFNSYEFGIHYDEFVPFGVLEE